MLRAPRASLITSTTPTPVQPWALRWSGRILQTARGITRSTTVTTGTHWVPSPKRVPYCWPPTPALASTSNPTPIITARWSTPLPCAPGTAVAAATATRYRFQATSASATNLPARPTATTTGRPTGAQPGSKPIATVVAPVAAAFASRAGNFGSRRRQSATRSIGR